MKKADYPKLESDLVWQPLGETIGKGSFHFSLQTSKLLAEFQKERKDYQQVNSVFGEGTSPKLRNIRDGLTALGLKLRWCSVMSKNGYRLL